VTDAVAASRARRDACLAHFAIVSFICFFAATVTWVITGEGGMGYASIAATLLFVSSWVYGVVTWFRLASAQLELRRLRNQGR